MNVEQSLWWKQAKSDYALFLQLCRAGAHSCHKLHYLQMATEKLSKAYLWRSGKAPPRCHTGFVSFLKAIRSRTSERISIARAFKFNRAKDFELWLHSVLALAYSLQYIAPALAGDGPNPEYPWPHHAPTDCPAEHDFKLWNDLVKTGPGRKLMQFIGHAIDRFDHFA